MDNLDKIKARIAKMLNMASNNSNEHEAAQAARRAREMMDRHQLTELDIGEIRSEAWGMGQARSGKDYAFMPIWRDTLAVAVARYNDCQSTRAAVSRITSVRYMIEFRGLESDVTLADMMYSYLCDTVDTLCKEYMKSKGYVRYNARVGDAFKKSCGGTINERLREMTKEREALGSSATGTGLMVVKQQLVDGHFGAASYKTVTIKTSGKSDARDAAEKGRQAGATVEIVKSLT